MERAPLSGFTSPPLRTMHRSHLIWIVLALSLGTQGCWFRKNKPRVFVPPPVQVRPVSLPPQPELPEPPGFDVKIATQRPEFVPDLPTLPPPPAPPKRPVIAAPKAPPPPQLEPLPTPRLGQIFTAEQLREYNRTLDDSLERVRRTLAVIAGKSLNAEQTEAANRIRTFLRQAEQTREQDLVTAASLARRADVLAQDLAARLP